MQSNREGWKPSRAPAQRGVSVSSGTLAQLLGVMLSAQDGWLNRSGYSRQTSSGNLLPAHRDVVRNWGFSRQMSSGRSGTPAQPDFVSRTGYCRQTDKGKAWPAHPTSGRYSGLARQTSSGSLHLAVAIMAGLARHTDRERPSLALYPRPLAGCCPQAQLAGGSMGSSGSWLCKGTRRGEEWTRRVVIESNRTDI